MPQAEIWRQGRFELPRVARASWWQRHRGAILPQIGLVFGILLLLCGALWVISAYVHHQAEVRGATAHGFLTEFASWRIAAPGPTEAAGP